MAGSPSPHAPRGASTSQAARRDRGRPPRRATAFASQAGPLSAPSGQRTPPRGHPVPPPCAPARSPCSRKRRVPTVPGAARGRSRLGSADTTPRAAPRPRPGWRTPAAKRAPGHDGVAAVGCAPALFEPRARRLPSTRPGTARTLRPRSPGPRPPAHLLDGLLRDLPFASRPGGREGHRHGRGCGISPRSSGFILRLLSAARGAHSPQSLGGGGRGGRRAVGSPAPAPPRRPRARRAAAPPIASARGRAPYGAPGRPLCAPLPARCHPAGPRARPPVVPPGPAPARAHVRPTPPDASGHRLTPAAQSRWGRASGVNRGLRGRECALFPVLIASARRHELRPRHHRLLARRPPLPSGVRAGGREEGLDCGERGGRARGTGGGPGGWVGPGLVLPTSFPGVRADGRAVVRGLGRHDGVGRTRKPRRGRRCGEGALRAAGGRREDRPGGSPGAGFRVRASGAAPGSAGALQAAGFGAPCPCPEPCARLAPTPSWRGPSRGPGGLGAGRGRGAGLREAGPAPCSLRNAP